jgi:hypothetical protein
MISSTVRPASTSQSVGGLLGTLKTPNRTGKWVTGVGIFLAAIQAWPVVAGWLGLRQ